jgi:putative ABC transport system permease protein
MFTRFSLLSEYFIMAWMALKSHKMRSALTTLGILIGVTTIITIFTTIQGMNEYVMGQFSKIGSSTVYVQKWPWVIRGDFWKYRNRKEVTNKEYEALARYSKVADFIAPTIWAIRSIKYKNEVYEQVQVLGTNEQYKDTDNIAPAVGRFLTEMDVYRNHKVCVLGDKVAQNLFKEEAPLGKRIKIGSDKYRVIGVTEKQGEAFGQSMDNFVLIPYGSFRRVTSGHRGMMISMAVTDNSKVEDMVDEVRGIMRQTRKIPPDGEDDFAINQQDQLTQTYRDLTGTLFMIVFVIGGISLLVGGIGITNIMLVSVTERTREIGIRKAIGARRRNILSQFIIESIAIASIGGIIGIIIGYIGGTIILSQMNLTTGVSVAVIMVGFGFSAFVGVVAGFYPAWKAAKMNPIDSLHFE